jgi:hypothetical protein
MRLITARRESWFDASAKGPKYKRHAKDDPNPRGNDWRTPARNVETGGSRSAEFPACGSQRP